MGFKYVGHKVAKERLQELKLGLTRGLKIKKSDGDIYSFAYASYVQKNAKKIANRIEEKIGRPTLIVKSGKVYEVYESRGAKKKPKAMPQTVLIRTLPKSPRITPKRPKLRR